MHALALALAAAVLLQDSMRPASLRAHRAGSPPAIDGRLDDAAWKEAEVGDDFRQWEPVEGQPATERTEIRILYDNTSLYVGVRLFDSEPDRIVTRLSRRDTNPDADRFTFYVDALHDRLTGAAFEISAGGGQRDSIISNDTNLDSSWDGVWESAVSIDGQGWSAEIRIPLSQLRFLKSDRQTWGFNVERFIYRKNERVWFRLVPRRETGLASRMAELTDIDGVEPSRALEIMPYAAARNERIRPLVGNPFNGGSRYFGATGVDLKFPLRPNVVLNAAVNPDFGQVEIDPAVVNLGAFEVFFPERRPFFIEGAQIFANFGNLGANNFFGFNRSEPTLIHTRRIGRAPQGRAEGEFVDVPPGSTILGAAKLTGKTTSGWSFGVLDAVTDRERASTSAADGGRSRVEVEPRSNYFAARVLREFGRGRSGVGAIVTAVNRGLRDGQLAALLPGRANVAGVDAYHFLDSGRVWVATGRVAFSDVAGSASAIERLQLAPQRFLQRTDTPHVRLDPARTTLRGWTGSANLNRNQGAWTVNAALWAVSPGFESGDLGFHFNGDAWGNHVVLTWRQIRPDRLTRDRNIVLAKFYTWNYGGTKLSDGTMAFGNVTFRNYWSLGGNLGVFREGQDDRLTRGGPPARELPSGFAGVNLGTDARRALVVRLNGGVNWSDSGSTGGDGGVSVEWKPSPRLNLSSGPSYSHQVNVAQYVTTADDVTAEATHGRRYVFARLQQKNLTLDTRVNVLFSPKATLQVYMQPLVVVGDYLDFKSFARPKTFDFEPYPNVPFDPDFNFKSLRLNAIFRWEWRLGSTMYVAWTQQRQDPANPGQFRLGRDLGRVFTGPADNVLFVKVTRWFSR